MHQSVYFKFFYWNPFSFPGKINFDCQWVVEVTSYYTTSHYSPKDSNPGDFEDLTQHVEMYDCMQQFREAIVTDAKAWMFHRKYFRCGRKYVEHVITDLSIVTVGHQSPYGKYFRFQLLNIFGHVCQCKIFRIILIQISALLPFSFIRICVLLWPP